MEGSFFICLHNSLHAPWILMKNVPEVRYCVFQSFDSFDHSVMTEFSRHHMWVIWAFHTTSAPSKIFFESWILLTRDSFVLFFLDAEVCRCFFLSFSFGRWFIIMWCHQSRLFLLFVCWMFVDVVSYFSFYREKCFFSVSVVLFQSVSRIPFI